MADKTIGSLPSAGSVGTSDLFVLEQNSTAKKLSGSTLVTYLLSMIDGHGGIVSISYSTSGTSGDGQTHTGTITYADNSTSTFTYRDGLKGDVGQAWFMWVRYASRNPIANTDMGTNPDAWMGIYSGTSATPPTNYTDYTWYNIKGATGDASTVTSVNVLYQASTSPTNPTGTWQSTIPSLDPGQYLLTQVTINFNSGSPVVFMTASYQGLDGSGAVNSVNGVGPDGNNNISLSAGDIPYNNSTVADELASLASGAASAQSQINASGILRGNGSGVVSAATKGTDYGAKSFTITLTANSWSSNQQTVSSTNFKASGFAYSIAPASAYIQDYKDSEIYADDITTDDQITFHCSTPPSGGITVNVMRVVSA